VTHEEWFAAILKSRPFPHFRPLRPNKGLQEHFAKILLRKRGLWKRKYYAC
jgi:hypothetical protein